MMRKRRKWMVALVVCLGGGLTLFLCTWDIVLFPQKQTATVLVLDNCDDDFRTPPFADTVFAFGPNGMSRIATNLNLCQTVGGNRALSVSPDGRFLVACENVGKHLTAYDTPTGRRLWNVDGEFTSATVDRNGMVYAAISSGTIYGERTVAIDEGGRITKNGNAGGFDIVLDERRAVLWLVGDKIRKCDLELNVLQELNPIKWCAVSVDITPDGSIWVAEREHPNVAQSTNRILKISSGGQILKSVYLDWSPMCLRVDPRDGSLWVTGIGVHPPLTQRLLNAIEGRTGPLPLGKWFRDLLTRKRVWSRTHKYDSEGRLLRTIDKGGHSLAIQPSDQSVWLAGKDKIYRYSREATKLARLGGVSADQKYVVVVPQSP
jgi:hypothetical protein